MLRPVDLINTTPDNQRRLRLRLAEITFEFRNVNGRYNLAKIKNTINEDETLAPHLKRPFGKSEAYALVKVLHASPSYQSYCQNLSVYHKA